MLVKAIEDFFDEVSKLNNNNKSVEFGFNARKLRESQIGKESDSFISYFSKIFKNIAEKYCILQKFDKSHINHLSVDFDNVNERFMIYCIYDDKIVEPKYFSYKLLLLTNHELIKIVARNCGKGSFVIAEHIVFYENDWIVLKRSIKYFSEIDRLFYKTISHINKQYEITDINKSDYMMASLVLISIAIKTIKLDNGDYDTRMIFYCTTIENYNNIKSFDENYNDLYRVDIPREIFDYFTRSHCYADTIKELHENSYCIANNFSNLLES